VSTESTLFDQNNQRGQDASLRCARRPGGPDRDLYSIRRPTQTDQSGRYGSLVCVGPLELLLKSFMSRYCSNLSDMLQPAAAFAVK
jgi:hypothetical protein